jgi:hypothetical protein
MIHRSSQPNQFWFRRLSFPSLIKEPEECLTAEDLVDFGRELSRGSNGAISIENRDDLFLKLETDFKVY